MGFRRSFNTSSAKARSSSQDCAATLPDSEYPSPDFLKFISKAAMESAHQSIGEEDEDDEDDDLESNPAVNEQDHITGSADSSSKSNCSEPHSKLAKSVHSLMTAHDEKDQKADYITDTLRNQLGVDENDVLLAGM